MTAKKTLILFAHGAGAPSTSAWMTAWAERLSALGKVVPFDYPYMQAGRKSPDRLPKLIEAHRQALNDARKRFRKRDRVILCGKSITHTWHKRCFVSTFRTCCNCSCIF